MMRRALVIVGASLLAARIARAEERTWIGASVGVEKVPHELLGDAPAIVDGLGLHHETQSTTRVVPQLSLTRDLESTEGHAFAIEASLRWFADSITATSPVSYRARRDVVPFGVLARFAVGGRKTRFVLGAGPTIALSRFDERGWLGDGTHVRPAFGGETIIGGRTPFSPDVGFTYLLIAEYLRLPVANPLLADGGDTWTVGMTLGLDLAL